MIGEKIQSLLHSIDNSKLFGDRIYPECLPPGTNYEKDSKDFPASFYTMSGFQTKENIDLVSTLWTVTVIANTEKQRTLLKNKVKEKFHRYKQGKIWNVYVSGMVDMKDESTLKYYSVITLQVTSYGEEI